MKLATRFLVAFVELVLKAWVLFALPVCAFVGAAVVFRFHGMSVASTPPSSSCSWPDAFYLSAVTFFTIGYGDRTPLDGCGRIAAGVLGLAGILFTGLCLAATVKALEDATKDTDDA